MKKYYPIILLLGCTALFVFGIVELFALRFESGDVYPPYSTLRSDPLGAMAFYEALDQLPGLKVSRDFTTTDTLPKESSTAYLHLAAEPYEFEWVPDDLFHEIKNFVGGGGRLVIAYSPQTSLPERDFDDEDETNSSPTMVPKAKDKNNPSLNPKKKKKHLKGLEDWINLEDEWGFHESYEELPVDGDSYQPVTVWNTRTNALPRALDWHSGIVFTNCDPAWHVVYTRGTNAVALERQFSKGSVVLVSDSYFFSNEAMTKDRQAAFLAWLIGPQTNIVFDEAHLGIADNRGIASLMRQYHLHGLAAGLLLLAGLFIWKNSTSLVPPHHDELRPEYAVGKDSASGFVNLLRRNIATRDILGVCFNEWKKSAAAPGSTPNSRFQQATEIFESDKHRQSGEQNPVDTYNQISQTLGNRKHPL